VRHGALTILATVLVMGSAYPVSAQDAARPVRGYGAGTGELIGRGVELSPTLRRMVSRLEEGDVVVFVQFSRCAGGVPACLLWATPTGGVRHLLVRLDRFDRSEDELIALLAHELQHAVEVARAPQVTDESSFLRLFAREGWRNADGFETAEAREITRQVLAELAPRASYRR
jgi:hypothetical protein